MSLELLEAHPPSRSSHAPLLFVHGAWHGAWCWADHVLPFMAASGYDAYAVSLRGHGGSPARPTLRRASLGDYVEDVLEAAAALPAPPVLVGHSMGGLVVQLALARAARARGGVLVASATPTGVLRATVRSTLSDPIVLLEANATLSLWPAVRTPARAAKALLRPGASAAEAARLQSRLQAESFLAFLGMFFARVDPARVGVPMLVIGAEADATFDQTDVRANARAYGVEAEFIPCAGHDLMLDPAWELLANRIVSWTGARGL